LLSCSCKLIKEKETDDLNSEILSRLCGNWKWVNSSGGFNGDTITPETEGYEKKLKLFKNYSYLVYKNGKIIKSGIFELSYGESIGSVEMCYQIKFQNEFLQSITFIGKNQLRLSEECYDCYSHLYER
jgi:hypothetical protein